jgi:hypothetical protein
MPRECRVQSVQPDGTAGLIRFNPMAFVLAVYVSRAGVAPALARLASGWWPAFAGQVWLPVRSLAWFHVIP